ncbi:MAG: hypothetical protein PVG02_08785, partial [Anaerolineales bacterium]
SQIATTSFFFQKLGHLFPSMTGSQRSAWSFACMAVVLGSEWCHNLAHTLMSVAIKQPVDAIRIHSGMPLLIYYQPNDVQVTPRQHILRAIGGPLFNLAVLPPLYILFRSTKTNTPGHFLAKLTFETNAFLATASLTPFPSLDGGPILKWALVQQGQSIPSAEKIVRKANAASAALLSILGLLSYLRGKKLLAILLGILGLSSAAIALGWLEEAY